MGPWAAQFGIGGYSSDIAALRSYAANLSLMPEQAQCSRGTQQSMDGFQGKFAGKKPYLISMVTCRFSLKTNPLQQPCHVSG